MPDDPGPDPTPPGPPADRARLLTRWIGTGIGAALLITVMALAFARDCTTSAQSHVLAVVLALGAAVLLWGIVGGLKVDLRLKFKALGEVTAGGIAAIFLVIHFVSADGIIAAGHCKEDPDPGVKVLYGRVFEHGAETQGVRQATVKVDMQTIETRTTDDDGHFDIIVRGDVPHVRVWVVKEGFADSVPVDADVPLAHDKIRIPLMKLVVQGEPPPKVEVFPTFVDRWDEGLARADPAAYEVATKADLADARALTNWARRAHSAGDYEWSTTFFDLAKAADPSGEVWYSDQGYLASAYRELGREQEAVAVRDAVAEAVRAGDPRIDEAWYDVTTRHLGLDDWRLDRLDRLPRLDPIGPRVPIGPGLPEAVPRGPELEPTAPFDAPTAKPADPRHLERGLDQPALGPTAAAPKAAQPGR